MMTLFQNESVKLDKRLERFQDRIFALMAKHSAAYAPGDRGHLAHNWTLGANPVLKGDAFKAARRVLRLSELSCRGYRAISEKRKRLLQGTR